MRGGDREQTPILDYRLMTGNPIRDRLALRLHPKARKLASGVVSNHILLGV